MTKNHLTGSVIISLFTLLLVTQLPLEEMSQFPGSLLFFYIKIMLIFIALLPPLYGLGLALEVLVTKVIGTSDSESLSDYSKTYQLVLIWSRLFFGILTAGWLAHLGFLWLPPTTLGVYVILGLGSAALIAFTPNVTLGRSLEVLKPILRQRSILLVMALIILGSLGVFHFQNHADAYLYHLSLAEEWIQKGHSGVVLSNIFSGYAGVTEHFYLLLKLLMGGNAEQNALAQLFHATFGWGSICIVSVAILHRWMPLPVASLIALIFMQSHIAHALFLPKNDGFLMACNFLGIYGIFFRRPYLFAAAACFAFIVKATAAVNFGILAVFWCLSGLNRYSLGFILKVVGLAGFFWLPFGINNFIQTGNPFFPLLNQIFVSPYAPSNIKDVVVEMRPFSLTFTNLGQSLLGFVTTTPVTIILFFLLLFGWSHAYTRQTWRQVFLRPDICRLGIFAFVSLMALLLVLGPLDGTIANRHFLVPIILSVILGYAALFEVLKRSTKPKIVFAIMFCLSLGLSQLDSRILYSLKQIREAKRTQESSGITASLLRQKPLLALNDWLTHTEPHHVKVLALSETNTSYFLKYGELWHVTKTYPGFKHLASDMSVGDWRDFCETKAFTHILIEKGYSPSNAATFAAVFPLAKKIDNFELYKLN